MNDIGVVPVREPFAQLITQGMVHGETLQSAVTGKYLRPGDVERRDGQIIEIATSQPPNVTWEKMSKVDGDNTISRNFDSNVL